ncbi:oligosaccharide repeat unit polymerase [Lactobacillus delbrueckii]|uniref:O-antigen polymerase n=1 Tax=Lactobacillus delbrueckii TaxID=1584 RepID=UPI0035187F5C|nr:oligosaccharide repeat unit polymerase [Lactobacillus delbrueckii]
MKHNGLNTGNVYTTFYQFYYDFGYSGIIPLVSGIAIFFSWLYYRIKKGINSHVLGTIVYAYLFNDLIMLIFSNRFYETTVNVGFIKFIIYLTILYYLLIKKHTRILVSD